MTDQPSTKVHVIITAPTGSGKSAIYGEIALAMQAIGIPVEHTDEIAWQSECRMTHADWESALELYKPTVVLEERNISPASTPHVEPGERLTADWCLNMADMEEGHQIGAGMPDHPLRAPAVEPGEREAIARQVHGAMKWAADSSCTDDHPEWNGGNSFAEDRARQTADAILALRPSDTGALREAAQFLSDRLDDLEWHDGALQDTLRNYMGHVDPAHARLRSALASTRHGERVEREALERFRKLERRIMADLGSAHALRGPGASSEMRSDDRDDYAEAEAAFAAARAALDAFAS